MSIERRPVASVTVEYPQAHPVLERLHSNEGDILVLGGAGISASDAGIANWWSAASGSRLDVFSLDSFRRDPLPFARLAKKLWPVDKKPTLTHRFVRLLELKGLLRRHYTQNIDGLDRLAGVSEKCLVETSGSFRNAYCVDCRQAFDGELLRQHVFSPQRVLNCKCGGLVKPDIVFSSEPYPAKFYSCSTEDIRNCGLIICLGASLEEEPFKNLIKRAPHHVPRLLINHEMPHGWETRPGDLVLIGNCDEHVHRLAQELDWADELEQLGRLTRTLHCTPSMLTDMLMVTKDILEGRWCDEFGQPVADILNSTIYWPQDPSRSTELHTTKNNRVMIELEDRLYYAKLESQGTRLEWSDGVLWHRGFRPPERKDRRGLKGSSESSFASETRATDTSSTRTGRTYVTGDSSSTRTDIQDGFGMSAEQMLEGEWSSATGEPIASIASAVVSWLSDPSVSTRVLITRRHSISMQLDGELYTGQLTASHTRIEWCDGEVWHHTWKPFGAAHVSSSSPLSGLSTLTSSRTYLEDVFAAETQAAQQEILPLSRQSSSEELITLTGRITSACDLEESDESLTTELSSTVA